MPTNEERQKVASQIRESVELFEMVGAGCPDYQYLIMELMNLNPALTTDKNRLKGLSRLADLIESEPMVDRDALLKIADEMDEFPDCGDIRCGKEMPPLLVHRFACRIREACGK